MPTMVPKHELDGLRSSTANSSPPEAKRRKTDCILDVASALTALSDKETPPQSPDKRGKGDDDAARFIPEHKKPDAALTFPEKLMKLMRYADKHKDDETYCAAWLEDGMSFVIRNPDAFTRNVLPRFFKQTKFSSFTRKLYRWGFRQVNRGIGPDDPIIFGNEFFQRDNAALMAKMRSVTAASQRKQEAANQAASNAVQALNGYSQQQQQQQQQHHHHHHMRHGSGGGGSRYSGSNGSGHNHNQFNGNGYNNAPSGSFHKMGGHPYYAGKRSFDNMNGGGGVNINSAMNMNMSRGMGMNMNADGRADPKRMFLDHMMGGGPPPPNPKNGGAGPSAGNMGGGMMGGMGGMNGMNGMGAMSGMGGMNGMNGMGHHMGMDGMGAMSGVGGMNGMDMFDGEAGYGSMQGQFGGGAGGNGGNFDHPLHHRSPHDFEFGPRSGHHHQFGPGGDNPDQFHGGNMNSLRQGGYGNEEQSRRFREMEHRQMYQEHHQMNRQSGGAYGVDGGIPNGPSPSEAALKPYDMPNGFSNESGALSANGGIPQFPGSPNTSNHGPSWNNGGSRHFQGHGNDNSPGPGPNGGNPPPGGNNGNYSSTSSTAEIVNAAINALRYAA